MGLLWVNYASPDIAPGPVFLSILPQPTVHRSFRATGVADFTRAVVTKAEPKSSAPGQAPARAARKLGAFASSIGLPGRARSPPSGRSQVGDRRLTSTMFRISSSRPKLLAPPQVALA
jgi:hypothetical protein